MAVAQTPPLYRVEVVAPPGGTGQALAVNAGGDVAGQINGTAFIWHAGHFTMYEAVRSFYLGDSFSNSVTSLNRFGKGAGHDGEYTPCVMSGLELASAVIYDRGTMRFIDRARDGQCSFEAFGINDVGTVVGVSGYRGFVRYANGSEVEIKPLSTREEYNGTRAAAVNNENVVVGGTTIDVPPVPQVQAGEQQIGPSGPMMPMYAPDTSKYVIHAFLLRIVDGRQHMRDLGAISGFPNTFATALNEGLIVVGYSGTISGPKWTRVDGPSHAWVWQNGTMTDIGHGTEDSFAYGVNDAGMIVGCSGDVAVRWLNKRMQNLNALIAPNSGWHLQCARAINRDGVIVGIGSYEGRTPVPFRLVPL